MGHGPGADRRVHGRLVRDRRRCCAARTSSSTRSRSSAAPRARTRRRRSPTSGSSARRGRRSSCASPGDALLATPMNGDIFGGGTGADARRAPGRPVARPRPRASGFGSMRTIRAEASATGPNVTPTLRLADGHDQGHGHQPLGHGRSSRAGARARLVGGRSSKDIAAGADRRRRPRPLNNERVQRASRSRSASSARTTGTAARSTRRSSGASSGARSSTSCRYDPMTGDQRGPAGRHATLLAWGNDPVVPAEIEGQQVRRVANVLYEVPLPFTVGGTTTFTGDLLRSSVDRRRARTSSRKDPWTSASGSGDARDGLPPAPVRGHVRRREGRARDGLRGRHRRCSAATAAALTEQARCDPAADGCVSAQDGLPDIEVLDVRTGEWVQFAHMAGGQATSSRTPRAGSTRRAARSRSGSSTSGRTASASSSRSQITGTVQVSGIVTADAASSSATTARSPSPASTSTSTQGEIFGLVGPERRRQDDDAAHPRDAAGARRGRRRDRRASRVRRNPNDVRRVLGFMPD